MNKELYKTVEEVEAKLQEARGELSRFEYEFPTDSPEQQLIVELLERLDEASDREVIEENVRDYSDDYGVDEVSVLAGEVVDGNIILSFGEPFEVTRTDGWVNEPEKEGDKQTLSAEITGAGYGREEETIVLDWHAPLRIALDFD